MNIPASEQRDGSNPQELDKLHVPRRKSTVAIGTVTVIGQLRRSRHATFDFREPLPVAGEKD